MTRRLALTTPLTALLLGTAPCGIAHAADPVTRTYGPGVWQIDTPQVFADSDTLHLQITGIGGGPCDPCSPLLLFLDEVQFGGTLQVTLEPGWFVYASLTYNLFSYQHSLPAGSFSQLHLPPLPEGLNWNTGSLYNSGYIMVQSPLAVPEPAAWALWLAGAALAAAIRTRKS